jgi:cell division protein FtsB
MRNDEQKNFMPSYLLFDPMSVAQIKKLDKEIEEIKIEIKKLNDRINYSGWIYFIEDVTFLLIPIPALGPLAIPVSIICNIFYDLAIRDALVTYIVGESKNSLEKQKNKMHLSCVALQEAKEKLIKDFELQHTDQITNEADSKKSYEFQNKDIEVKTSLNSEPAFFSVKTSLEEHIKTLGKDINILKEKKKALEEECRTIASELKLLDRDLLGHVTLDTAGNLAVSRLAGELSNLFVSPSLSMGSFFVNRITRTSIIIGYRYLVKPQLREELSHLPGGNKLELEACRKKIENRHNQLKDQIKNLSEEIQDFEDRIQVNFL